MKKPLLKSACAAIVLLCMSRSAFAFYLVFDPQSFAENVITAAKAVQGEIYQNTNIIYQYSMMENQLLQATTLAPTAMAQALSQIQSDVSNVTNYNKTLSSLYGSLNSSSAWLSNVQSLITQSGKTNDQWFSDMATLRASNDKSATTMFQMGSDVLTHVATLTARRQQLQTQLSASPTQQATAELTTHYLDVVSAQNDDMLQMMAAQQQRTAQKASLDNQQSVTNAAAMQKIIDSQTTQRSALNSAFPTSSTPE
jgi:hypothetical protein